MTNFLTNFRHIGDVNWNVINKIKIRYQILGLHMCISNIKVKNFFYSNFQIVFHFKCIKRIKNYELKTHCQKLLIFNKFTFRMLSEIPQTC